MIKTTNKKLIANTNSIKIDTKVICLSCLRSLDAYDVVYKIDHPRANVSFLMCLDCFIKIKHNPMYFDELSAFMNTLSPSSNVIPNKDKSSVNSHVHITSASDKTSISDKSSVNKNSPINNEKGGKNNEKTKDRVKTGTKSSGL